MNLRDLHALHGVFRFLREYRHRRRFGCSRFASVRLAYRGLILFGGVPSFGGLAFRLRVLRASARLFLCEYRYYRDYCDESRLSALRWSWIIAKHRVLFWGVQASRLAQESGQQLEAKS